MITPRRKLLVIESCSDCPHCQPIFYCSLAKPMRYVTNGDGADFPIPDWCPLEDAPERREETPKVCPRCGKDDAMFNGVCHHTHLLEDAPATTWTCGCGHTNGCNLATCAACGRKPGATQ